MDQDLFRQEIVVRIDAIDARSEQMQAQLAELCDILDSFRGAMKVLDTVGKIAKPLTYVVGLVTAVSALFHFGGQK